MPVVTVNPGNFERYELKSAPADPSNPEDENGYVMLRPLPYGQKLTRRDRATKMMMRQQPVKKGVKQDNTIELESYNEWAVAFDFAYCIGDHNLTDEKGQKLDFSKPMSLKTLDPKVGSEIERLINNLNEDESEETIEDFLSRSNTSSMDEDRISELQTRELSENGGDRSEIRKVTSLETPTIP